MRKYQFFRLGVYESQSTSCLFTAYGTTNSRSYWRSCNENDCLRLSTRNRKKYVIATKNEHFNANASLLTIDVSTIATPLLAEELTNRVIEFRTAMRKIQLAQLLKTRVLAISVAAGEVYL